MKGTKSRTHGLATPNRDRQTVLVTGGAGFIGSHVCAALASAGRRVLAFDNLSTGCFPNLPSSASLIVGDIRSEEDLKAAFAREPIDAIVHCAAQTSVERSMIDPEFDHDVNVRGTWQLATYAHRAHVRRFVFLSSGGAIYGETHVPATERSLPAPRSFYGFHKYAAEELVRASGVSAAILRPSNVYGPRQRADAEGGVIAIFAQRLVRGDPLKIHGDGRQVRDFVHVSGVVAAVLRGMDGEDQVVWNVASGQGTTILALSALLARLLRVEPRLSFGPRRAGDIDSSLLSAASLLRTGSWPPPLSLREGLRLTFMEPRTSPPVRSALVAEASKL